MSKTSENSSTSSTTTGAKAPNPFQKQLLDAIGPTGGLRLRGYVSAVGELEKIKWNKKGDRAAGEMEIRKYTVSDGTKTYYLADQNEEAHTIRFEFGDIVTINVESAETEKGIMTLRGQLLPES